MKQKLLTTLLLLLGLYVLIPQGGGQFDQVDAVSGISEDSGPDTLGDSGAVDILDTDI